MYIHIAHIANISTRLLSTIRHLSIKKRRKHCYIDMYRYIFRRKCFMPKCECEYIFLAHEMKRAEHQNMQIGISAAKHTYTPHAKHTDTYIYVYLDESV